jgi:hypothetical protein
MCFWTHEKKTFFSYPATTRSGGGSQGRTFFVRRASGRSAAQSLDGHRSGGYSRHRRPPLCFQHVHAQQPPRYRQATTEHQSFLLVADSTRVHPQQPVNTSLFAVPGCSPLIPLTFPPGNLRLLPSSHLGVTRHPTPDAKQRALCFRSARLPDGTQTQQGRPERRPAAVHASSVEGNFTINFSTNRMTPRSIAKSNAAIGSMPIAGIHPLGQRMNRIKGT